ncbi:MAG TPA: DUF1257 domain-containing protein [Phycisphaerae bacterium]|nr:DUF1257 domain-containing protein [Phycisphaerae bacterium]HUX16885.1 DUF1257 domain-containing protein [Phycisphaerae bacterium]
MSHLVTIQTRMRDPAALAAACRRLGLAEPVHGTMTAADGATAEGLLVCLPGWRVPVAVRADGTVATERWNFGRRLSTDAWEHDDWPGLAYSDEAQPGRLLQAYAVEAARIEARRRGRSITERALPDGSIRLVIQEA